MNEHPHLQVPAEQSRTTREVWSSTRTWSQLYSNLESALSIAIVFRSKLLNLIPVTAGERIVTPPVTNEDNTSSVYLPGAEIKVKFLADSSENERTGEEISKPRCSYPSERLAEAAESGTKGVVESGFDIRLDHSTEPSSSSTKVQEAK